MKLSANGQRGLILFQQGRYLEAEKYFRESLAVDPDDAPILYYLALCCANQDNAASALTAIDGALALLPEDANYHALRSLILIDHNRVKEALAGSDEAIRLDPESDYVFVLRAQLFAVLSDWRAAEKAARRALEINPENQAATNQLALALRRQHRLRESAKQAANLLALEPEDACNQETVGWIALQGGQRAKAELHFIEALRLDPNCESARTGLKEAFKAKFPPYRIYLQCCLFREPWIIAGIVIIVLYFLTILIPDRFKDVFWGAGPTIFFLVAFWLPLAPAIGNLQIWFDPSTRHALHPRENGVHGWPELHLCSGLSSCSSAFLSPDGLLWSSA